MLLLVKNRTADAEENLMMMRLMDERQLDHPTHGILQMQDYLRDEGYTVNYKRVRRLLRLMGLRAIYPQKNLSKLGLAKYIHPYLLRNLKIDRPNHVWEIDITGPRRHIYRWRRDLCILQQLLTSIVDATRPLCGRLAVSTVGIIQ